MSMKTYPLLVCSELPDAATDSKASLVHSRQHPARRKSDLDQGAVLRGAADIEGRLVGLGQRLTLQLSASHAASSRMMA
jgi:hypothetical protein